ncbi:hypothetical protein CCHR01_16435 [Colletotrichum chrysophilum]|uniref:Uncharacterized protein n=1 Tax=Colletotrichum chrysophilum TaxID=1836956 RepID=A0AAD9EAU6_9PEZI|nr:hypothetical protein CCHR01_16435 [Colletotrichum chrysophilum]
MKSVDLRGLWPRVHSKSGAKTVSRTFLSPFVLGCDLQSERGFRVAGVVLRRGDTRSILGGRAIREVDRR